MCRVERNLRIGIGSRRRFWLKMKENSKGDNANGNFVYRLTGLLESVEDSCILIA